MDLKPVPTQENRCLVKVALSHKLKRGVMAQLSHDLKQQQCSRPCLSVFAFDVGRTASGERLSIIHEGYT